MITVSDELWEALHRPFGFKIRVRSWRIKKGTPAGHGDAFDRENRLLLWNDIPIISGSVTMDLSSDPMRTLSITVPLYDPDSGVYYAPTHPNSPLAPWGQYLSVEYGVRMNMDGSRYAWIPLGEFPIQSATVNRPDGTIDVEAADWSSRVAEYTLVRARTVKGSAFGMIKNFCNEAIDGLGDDINIQSSAKVTDFDFDKKGRKIEAGGSRWEAIQQLADEWPSSHGGPADVYFNAIGKLCIRRSVDIMPSDPANPKPTPYDTVGVSVDPNSDFGTITSLQSTVSRDSAHNAAVVALQVENTNAKDGSPKLYIGQAWEGSKSPIPFSNWFGRMPLLDTRTVNKSKASQANADAQAAALLKKRRGLVRTVSFETTPLPYLEPGDLIAIQYPKLLGEGIYQPIAADAAQSLDRAYVWSITLPLDGSAMSVTTRADLVSEDPGPLMITASDLIARTAGTTLEVPPVPLTTTPEPDDEAPVIRALAASEPGIDAAAPAINTLLGAERGAIRLPESGKSGTSGGTTP